eukprot:1740640-Rhodomonas_salina.1
MEERRIVEEEGEDGNAGKDGGRNGVWGWEGQKEGGRREEERDILSVILSVWCVCACVRVRLWRWR